MISYNWEILSLHTVPHQNGLNDVVKQINWRFQASDGVYFGDISGYTELIPPSHDSYIQYQNLTEETIQNWILENVNYDELVQTVNQKLDENKNPSIVEKTPPWHYDGHVPGDTEYLVVIDDQPNNLIKIWGPLHWDSSRINKGLQLRGFEDLRVPENMTMIRKGLLPVDKPLTLTERVKIYRVDYVNKQFDELTQQRGELTWSTTTGRVVGTFENRDKSIEEIKTGLKEFLNQKSTYEQHQPVDLILNGNVVKSYIDTQTYLVTTNRMYQMSDTETVNWKLVDRWVVMTKEDLLQLSILIKDKIQSIFDFEFQKVELIESAQTVEELKQIYTSIKG